MAIFSFRLPDIGEGVAEAEIVSWHVAVGDSVEEDQVIADVMTDKATVEMTSPVSGTVTALAGEVGDVVPIGSTLVTFETEAVADAPTSHDEPPAIEVAMPDKPESEIPAVPVAPNSAKILASPAVRERARELGVDLSMVKASAGGRIRHADLDAYLQYHAGQGYGTAGAGRQDEVIKVTGLRRRIAENMAASKRHIPHFTYVEEIDVTDLEALRASLNAKRGERPRLTLLPFLIVAIARVLPDYPMINAHYDDEANVVTRYGALHLGIATQTGPGLVVPVLRDAQDRNIWQLAREIADLADRARAGKLSSAELSGSTLTITSLGPLGGIASTPVINRPEVAIIGPNRIVERPVFRGSEVVPAKLMNLSISCDHRVVDGWDAASFVQAMKALLETPALLFV